MTARGRPPAGYFTKRSAEAWLRRVLAEAAAGTLPGIVRTGATAADACAEYLRYIDQTASGSHPRSATTPRSSATTSCLTSATWRSRT